MRRHDHFHEVLGHAVSAFAFHQNLVNLAVIKIADRAFDQVAFFIDFRRCHGLKRQLADLFPQALQIFVIALDLGLGALGTGGPHDQPRALRHVDPVGNLFQLLAVGGIGDLAADPAATGGVRHQHAIPAGQRQIGGQGRALVAALFLDDLHQQDLANLDDFLNLIAFRARFAHRADVFLVIVIRHGFDAFIHRGGVAAARFLFFALVIVFRRLGGGFLGIRFGRVFGSVRFGCLSLIRGVSVSAVAIRFGGVCVTSCVRLCRYGFGFGFGGLGHLGFCVVYNSLFRRDVRRTFFGLAFTGLILVPFIKVDGFHALDLDLFGLDRIGILRPRRF